MLHMQLNACVRLLGIESEAVIIDNDNPLIIMCLNFLFFFSLFNVQPYQPGYTAPPPTHAEETAIDIRYVKLLSPIRPILSRVIFPMLFVLIWIQFMVHISYQLLIKLHLFSIWRNTFLIVICALHFFMFFPFLSGHLF